MSSIPWPLVYSDVSNYLYSNLDFSCSNVEFVTKININAIIVQARIEFYWCSMDSGQITCLYASIHIRLTFIVGLTIMLNKSRPKLCTKFNVKLLHSQTLYDAKYVLERRSFLVV